MSEEEASESEDDMVKYISSLEDGCGWVDWGRSQVGNEQGEQS